MLHVNRCFEIGGLELFDDISNISNVLPDVICGHLHIFVDLELSGNVLFFPLKRRWKGYMVLE